MTYLLVTYTHLVSVCMCVCCFCYQRIRELWVAFNIKYENAGRALLTL